MSKCEGLLHTCDRCGSTDFRKLLGTKDLDGGYSQYKEYEEVEGWLNITQMGDLCPNCADEFKRFVTNFMGGRIAPAWKYDAQEAM